MEDYLPSRFRESGSPPPARQLSLSLPATWSLASPVPSHFVASLSLGPCRQWFLSTFFTQPPVSTVLSPHRLVAPLRPAPARCLPGYPLVSEPSWYCGASHSAVTLILTMSPFTALHWEHLRPTSSTRP